MTTTDILAHLGVFVVDDPAAQLTDTTVWVVTADTFRDGHYDLDNRTELIGAYATLDAVAEHLPLMMGQPDSRIFHPIATQVVVKA